MEFNEALFVRALMERPADARKFAQNFEPAWLKTAELQPILATVFDFTQQHSLPPSINALRVELIKKDKTAYDVRYKEIVDDLEAIVPDTSEVLQCISDAKNVAVAWSLESLFNSPDMIGYREDMNGKEILHKFQQWMVHFSGVNENKEMRIGEAIDELIKSKAWDNPETNIPCGIDVIDQWTGGGLRPKNLGIIIAPTGHFKTHGLIIMAYKMSLIGRKRVLFITNEISMGEVAERFGALISGEHLNTVMHNPHVVKERLETLYKYDLNKNLYLAEINEEFSTHEIEAMIGRYESLYGWVPEVVVIDYMERMKPTVTSKRDQSWNWYGYIAKDLSRLAKKYNLLIWTAGQTNRGGMNTSVETSLAHAQGSIQHLQEAAAVVCIRQRSDLDMHLDNPNERVLEFTPLKMRHSKRVADSVFYSANLGKMSISIEPLDTKKWEDAAEGDLPVVHKPRGKRKYRKDDEEE